MVIDYLEDGKWLPLMVGIVVELADGWLEVPPPVFVDGVGHVVGPIPHLGVHRQVILYKCTLCLLVSVDL